jgi:O-antigen ligase
MAVLTAGTFLLLKATPANRIKYSVRYIIPGILLLIGIFIYVNNLSQGNLLLRYEGITQNSEKFDETKLLSGRNIIMAQDIDLFIQNPILGIGVGESELFHVENQPAHTEYTRMLSEHGIFGLVALVFLLILVSKEFLQKDDLNKKILISLFITSAMVSMTHNATRVGINVMPIGIAFLTIAPSRNPLESVSNDLLLDKKKLFPAI